MHKLLNTTPSEEHLRRLQHHLVLADYFLAKHLGPTTQIRKLLRELIIEKGGTPE